MSAGPLVLVGGGVRTGKSRFALERAREAGPRRVLLATAEPTDHGMKERIRRHQEDRGDDFLVVEEPLELPKVVLAIDGIDVLVVDCLTVWIANQMLRGGREEEIVGSTDALLEALADRPFTSILVTNEVGMGVHPPTALGLEFRDICGRVHQRVAARTDEVYLGVLGIMLRLKPGPVGAMGR